MLTDREAEILRFLASEGEMSKYDVKDKCDIPYSTVHNTFKKLEEKELIQEEREESSNRNVRKIIYDTTTRGLFASFLGTRKMEAGGRTIGLQDCRDMIEECRDIIENNAKRSPLIFGKWDFYEEKGDFAEVLLNEVLHHLFKFSYDYSKNVADEVLLRDCFEDYLFPGGDVEWRIEMVKELKKDPEICNVMQEANQDNLEHFQEELEHANRINKILGSSSESNDQSSQ